MFSKVLVPIDFSEEADRVLRFVKGLQPLGLKQVVLVHCMDMGRAPVWPLPEKMQSVIASRLEQRKAMFEGDGIRVNTVLAEGSPSEEILRVVEDEKASMVVTGSHGKRLLEELLLGSVSEALGRASTVPVLMVRYDLLRDIERHQSLEDYATTIYRRILCPSDFSGPAEKALDLALKLKKVGAEEITLMHIVNTKQVETEEEKAELLDICAEEVNKGVARVKRSGLKADGICRSGDPLREILEAADSKDATIIVMGSHGKSIVKEWLVGSVSLNVVRVAGRPALLVHE